MKNRKIDPQIAKVQRAVSNQSVSEKVQVSITVGKRVVASATVQPSNRGELLRLKANRPKDEEAYPTAFSGTIVNDLERRELYAQVEVEGAILNYGIGKFGRSIEYAWLRINGRCVERIYSKEGLDTLIKA